MASIPGDLAALARLESLEIGEPGDLLAHDRPIPPAVWRLPRLRTLSVFGSSATSLPDALGDLADLTELSLVETRIAALPASIGRLRKLSRLVLDDNRLARLPVEALAGLPLEHVSLSGNDLPEAEIRRLREALPAARVET
jgi:Leucine-rich repeat (LRR) protein